MGKRKARLDYKYTPKLWAAITYLLLVLAALVLFMGRTVKAVKFDVLSVLFHDFYFHISNFSISLLVYLTMGYVWLLAGLRLRAVAIAGGVLIGINFIYELFIPILNTLDIVDAYYGLAGITFGFLFLFFTARYGLNPKSRTHYPAPTPRPIEADDAPLHLGHHTMIPLLLFSRRTRNDLWRSRPKGPIFGPFKRSV